MFVTLIVTGQFDATFFIKLKSL